MQQITIIDQLCAENHMYSVCNGFGGTELLNKRFNCQCLRRSLTLVCLCSEACLARTLNTTQHSVSQNSLYTLRSGHVIGATVKNRLKYTRTHRTLNRHFSICMYTNTL